MRKVALVAVAIGIGIACGTSSSSQDGGADAALDASPMTDAALDADAGPPYGDRNLGVSEPYPDSLLVQNGGRFYNVRRPPSGGTPAMGDGTTDDTLAFTDAYDFLVKAFLAATGVPGNTKLNAPNSDYADEQDSYWIYVPDGTYLVKDTLFYTHAGLQPYYQGVYGTVGPFGSPWFDLTRVRLVGQSREGTILRLADGATGFDQPSKPKAVVTFQHPTTSFNDWNADNLLKNITIDTGSKNPGAVGVMMQGANVSGLRNVLVRSGDGAGTYGIWLPVSPVQGCYHDVTVRGFDYGIAQNNTTTGGLNGCFENVTLTEQNKAGIVVGESGFFARNVLADETAHGAPAVWMQPSGAQLVVIDSLLEGTVGPAIVVDSTTKNSVFVRNVVTRGYASAVSYGNQVVAPGPNVTEWSSASEQLFDGGPPASLALPIEQVPLAAWHDPATQWASVDSFMVDGGSQTAAAQAALSSGKPVVVFPSAAYATGKLSVPATVERIDLLYSHFPPGFGELDVTEASTTPLLVENGSGATFDVVIEAQRDVAIRMGANLVHNTSKSPLRVFIENGGGGYSADFVPPGTTVWARGLDIEYRSAPQFLASGGTLWIAGYKTEQNAGSVLGASAGSSVEILSGYTYISGYIDASPMMLLDDASVSFVGTVTSGNAANRFAPVVSETEGTVTRTSDAGAFPGYVGRNNGDFVVPLYVARP